MDHYRETRNILTWHNEGKFEVELVNGVITRLNFFEPGKGPADTGKCLTSTSYKFLQAVYSCLGELFAFIEEENKRLGYSYSSEGEVQHHGQDENEENTYVLPSETKLKPLINYTHQQNMIDSRPENEELMRDIG